MSSQTKWLGVIVGLQLFTLIGQWVGGPTVPAAMAQVPDAGAQRNQIIDELHALNLRMDKLIGILTSGNVQVKVGKGD